MTGARGPRSQAERRRNNKPAPRTTVIIPDEVPALPPAPNGDPYPEVVQEWYRTWRSSGYAAKFDEIDWNTLHRLAPLVMAFWSAFDPNLLREIERGEEVIRRRTDGRPSKPASGEAAATAAAKPKRDRSNLRVV